jgi:hypothetical protein
VLVGLPLFNAHKRNPTDGGNDMNWTIEKTEGEQKQVIAALASLRAPVPAP